jgi:CRP/FNR family transcriptional regulator, cyclic AMP receptor protein
MNPITVEDLSGVFLFSGLPSDELETLAHGSTRRGLADGEVLFEQGQEARTLYVVVRGGLILRTEDRGRAVIVDTLRHGDVVGWAAMREAAITLSTARAVGTTEVIGIPVDDIVALAAGGSRESRLLVRRIVGLAAQHLEESWKQLLQVGREGVITAG